MLHDFTEQLALHQPDNPERFIYEMLHKKYAECAPGPECTDEHAPGVDYLRLEVECGLNNRVRRAPLFIRRAPSTNRKTSLFRDWKREAMAALDAEVTQGMGIPPTRSAEKTVLEPTDLPPVLMNGTMHLGEEKTARSRSRREEESSHDCTEPERAPDLHVEAGISSECRADSIAGAGRKTDGKWREDMAGGVNDVERKAHSIAVSWSALHMNGISFTEILKIDDTDKSGDLSFAEFCKAARVHSGLKDGDESEDNLKRIFYSVSNHKEHITAQDLEAVIELAVARQHLADWLAELNLNETLALRLLPGGGSPCSHAKVDPNDPISCLAGLESVEPLRERLRMAQDELLAYVCRALDDYDEARAHEVPNGAAAKSGKFAWDLEESQTEAQFADIQFFRKGLIDLIGLPDMDIRRGMEAEHCSGEGSNEPFTTSNYMTTTTPEEEWQFVVQPSEGKVYAGEWSTENPAGRERVPIEKLMEVELAQRSGLTQEEVIALRLYTGPMYMFYNRVLRELLRRFREREKELQEQFEQSKDARGGGGVKPHGVLPGSGDGGDVKYRTTIHMISSGIVKLAEAMERPQTRKIYRGLSGMKLPDCFYTEDELGWKGAVEVAFMSCTLKREVALQYLGSGKMPIMFEIETSQIDRGGDLSWCSQYPAEAEVLLPPLSNLEVTSGPKMVAHKGKTICVFQMQLNVNLKIMKREEHEGNRKGLHLASVKNTYLELQRDLHNTCLQIKEDEKTFNKGPSGGAGKHVFNQSKNFEIAVSIAERIMWEVDELVGAQDKRHWKWYNNDRNYKLALEEVALLKEMALAKFSWWYENPTVATHNIDQLRCAMRA